MLPRAFRATLAWLRAIRRGTRSRAPDLTYSFPSGAGRSLRSLGYAHTRAARSRRPGLRPGRAEGGRRRRRPYPLSAPKPSSRSERPAFEGSKKSGGEGRGEVGDFSPLLRHPARAVQEPSSPCPASALPGRRRRRAPTPPSFPLRPSAGRGTGGTGPGCEAARRLTDTREKKRGQATAVTVPREPRGGGRLSRSARWPVRVRAAQMSCNTRMNKPIASFSIALRNRRQDPRWLAPPGQGGRRTGCRTSSAPTNRSARADLAMPLPRPAPAARGFGGKPAPDAGGSNRCIAGHATPSVGSRGLRRPTSAGRGAAARSPQNPLVGAGAAIGFCQRTRQRPRALQRYGGTPCGNFYPRQLRLRRWRSRHPRWQAASPSI